MVLSTKTRELLTEKLLEWEKATIYYYYYHKGSKKRTTADTVNSIPVTIWKTPSGTSYTPEFDSLVDCIKVIDALQQKGYIIQLHYNNGFRCFIRNNTEKFEVEYVSFTSMYDAVINTLLGLFNNL